MSLSCHIPRDRLTPRTLYLRYQDSHCLLPPLPRRTSSQGYVKSPAPLMVPPHGMFPGVVRVVHIIPLFIRRRFCHTCCAVSRHTRPCSPGLATLGYLRQGLHVVDSPDDQWITPVPHSNLVTGKCRRLEASTRGDQIRNDQLTAIVFGQLLQPAGHMHR